MHAMRREPGRPGSLRFQPVHCERAARATSRSDVQPIVNGSTSDLAMRTTSVLPNVDSSRFCSTRR